MIDLDRIAEWVVARCPNAQVYRPEKYLLGFRSGAGSAFARVEVSVFAWDNSLAFLEARSISQPVDFALLRAVQDAIDDQ